jgi:hypothetical protein
LPRPFGIGTPTTFSPVKDNQPTLYESITDFFEAFQAAPAKTPHTFDEVAEKDHSRPERRRCYAFDQIDCLHAPERWLRLAPSKRKGGLKLQRLIAATSDFFRAQMLGLVST